MPNYACPQAQCLVDAQNGFKTLTMHIIASIPPMPMIGVNMQPLHKPDYVCYLPGIMAQNLLMLYIT